MGMAKMQKSELIRALTRLGEICSPDTRIVLAGGAALILGGFIERSTDDGDVVHSEPSLASIQDLVGYVADERALSPAWLNDGVKAWADVLPQDFGERLEEVGTFGNLHVRRLGRLDLLVMKFFALREQDLEDLEAMRPTAGEIAFVRAQLGRIAQTRPDKAMKMQLYLDQGAALATVQASAKAPPHRGGPVDGNANEE